MSRPGRSRRSTEVEASSTRSTFPTPPRRPSGAHRNRSPRCRRRRRCSCSCPGTRRSRAQTRCRCRLRARRPAGASPRRCRSPSPRWAVRSRRSHRRRCTESSMDMTPSCRASSAGSSSRPDSASSAPSRIPARRSRAVQPQARSRSAPRLLADARPRAALGVTLHLLDFARIVRRSPDAHHFRTSLSTTGEGSGAVPQDRSPASPSQCADGERRRSVGGEVTGYADAITRTWLSW